MKRIIFYLFFTGLYCLSFSQDTTSRLSKTDMQDFFHVPDHLKSEILFFRRGDTMFVVNKYIRRDPVVYEYMDTLYYDSGQKWYSIGVDKHVVYYLRKTRAYDDEIGGYEYKRRKTIVYKNGKKTSCTVFLGGMCYTKRYDDD